VFAILKEIFQPRSITKAPELGSVPSVEPVIEAALELEKRLYESAVAAVEQTFAKEALVATFLTSGSIVVFGSSLQAYGDVASNVEPKGSTVGLIFLVTSLLFLAVGFLRLSGVLKGREVGDLINGQDFLTAMTDPVKGSSTPSREAVMLQMISEYQVARGRHTELVAHRTEELFKVLYWLGGSVAAAGFAVFVAFASVKGVRNDIEVQSPTYVIIQHKDFARSPSKELGASVSGKDKERKTMGREQNTGQTGTTPRPPTGPIRLPRPIGSSTPITKGGGG
jgi:hypothetical protein